MAKKIFQKGVIVIITFLTLGMLLILGTYFLSFTLTESRISKSQEVATQTYYLAEAGINETIWKLKNDNIWKTCFVSTSTEYNCLDCNAWQASFTTNYIQNSTTAVSIQNTQCAKGEIIATSTIGLPKGKTAQRVIKVKVIKAFGSLTEDSPVFAGSPSGESTIDASVVNVYKGNMFVNNNLTIRYWSTVNVYDDQTTETQEGKVLVVGNRILFWNSTLNSSSTCAKDFCNTTSTCECAGSDKFQRCTESSCPPVFVEMPMVDFDSDDPNSYKSKAEKAQQYGQCSLVGKDSGGTIVVTSNKCLFSEDEFADLLWKVGKKGTLILEHKANEFATSTYYVEGGIDLKGERYLEINGVLLADKTINIGEKSKWEGDYGFNQITIKDPGPGIPSGLLTKGKMNFGFYSSFKDINATGTIYSLEEMRLTSLPQTFNVKGGIIARKFSLTSAGKPLNIYLDNDITREGIWGGPQPPGEEKPPYSPVVTVEHWEETY